MEWRREVQVLDAALEQHEQGTFVFVSGVRRLLLGIMSVGNEFGHSLGSRSDASPPIEERSFRGGC
jgi:hypothetical protein